MRRHGPISRRTFRRLPPWAACLLLVVLLLARLFAPSRQHTPQANSALRPDHPYRVQRVVDGDTLVLETGDRIRLIGVDTPETKHPDRPVEPLGEEATEFTRRFVEGRTVTLEFDREPRDRYGRVLAYVYVDGRLLNEELILAGYGKAVTRFPYSDAMKQRFLAAEQIARKARRGLWALDGEGSSTGLSPRLRPSHGFGRKCVGECVETAVRLWNGRHDSCRGVPASLGIG